MECGGLNKYDSMDSCVLMLDPSTLRKRGLVGVGLALLKDVFNHVVRL